MANFKLIWDNKSDNSGLSGGSWEALLPITNTQDKLIQKTARSTNLVLSSTQFDVDTNPKQSIRSLILCNHNMSANALIRIRKSDSATFLTSDYDSGWVNVFESIYSPESVEWEDDNFWFGRLDQSKLEGYSVNYVHLFDANYASRYTRIEIDDGDNADGYVDIGRLMMAPIFEFRNNAIYGASISWKDPTIVSKSIGGSSFFDKRPKRRSYNFSTDFMDIVEALEDIFEIQRSQGVSGELFLLPDSDDLANTFRTSFLGNFTKLDGVTNHFFRKYKSSYSIEEIL